MNIHSNTVKEITLIMDNFKTHTPFAFMKTFEPEEAKSCGIDLNLYIPLNIQR